MPLSPFHPAVAAWFRSRFGTPTEPQERAWPSIVAGRNTLVAAPTGSGKTLAAFLAAIDQLVRASLAGELGDETRVVYVSPLKALSNDIQRNLEEPLAEIRRELAARGLPDAPIRTLVRTGDTPASVRAAMARKPPHILVTTPESLFILLTSESGRRMLATTRTAIVDEIHAVAGSKRGSHLSLSLARLEALCRAHHAAAGGPAAAAAADAAGAAGASDAAAASAASENRLVRIGLSATQSPIEEVARLLVGADTCTPASEASEAMACEIVDAGHRRALDLGVEVPSSPLEAVMAGEVWQEIYDRLAELIRAHRTTLVFVNTRRLAERATRHLADRLGEARVSSHHGSMSREQRLSCEQRLKTGQLSALVATSSLELGIDIGTVDLVCQLGSTRSISTFLQRVGRAGHRLAAIPKGRIFPTSRDELVETAALLDAVRRGELDRLIIPPAPLDILAQHIVAAVAAEEWSEDELFALVRRAWPYRDLSRADFDDVVAMLASGFSTRRGRRGAYLHQDAVAGRLRARKGARLAAITSGGAIPDTADYQVVLQPSNTLLGTVHEDFAVESMPGDVFQLGNAAWRIDKVEPGRVLVEDAHGQPPTIPFWLGEAPARTEELSRAVSRLRREIAERSGALPAAEPAIEPPIEPAIEPAADAAGACTGAGEAVAWLRDEVGVGEPAAAQLVSYLSAAARALGTMPSRTTLVAERFFDEAGDMHLVVHAPFGSRLNRAWGLALRKRFCQTFNFELQAAASEDAIILSLGPTHSFPLADAFHFLHSASVRQVVTQAVLDSPLFGVRWRWAASRALAVPRWRAGRRVPAPRLRQDAEDLVAVVFPDQLACLENIVGEREIPDHPLVAEALRDCLEEAMDTTGLERLLGCLERGELLLVARDVTEPSPLAHEILAARPYAFLDDAPLEERRTQAVRVRRWLDPETASDLGALDAAAIARVREEAWPEAESPDELHDALLTLAFITAEEGRRSGWEPLFDRLAEAGRATLLTVPRRRRQAAPPSASAGWVRQAGGESAAADTADVADAAGVAGLFDHVGLWVAAERLTLVAALHPDAVPAPAIVPPPRHAREWPPEEAAIEVVRGRLQALVPTTARELAAGAGLRPAAVEAALAALETEGFALRGHFTPAAARKAPGAGTNASAGAAAGGAIAATAGPVGTAQSPPPPPDIEWCERRLLARIHRYTLERLRREIEPVSQADFMRFLLSWQRVANTALPASVAQAGSAASGTSAATAGEAAPGPVGVAAPASGGATAGGGGTGVPGADAAGSVASPAQGAESLPALLAQLEGFEAPAAAWEGEILPARLPGYDPLWLDALCLAGRYVWGRLTPPAAPAQAGSGSAADAVDAGDAVGAGDAGAADAGSAGDVGDAGGRPRVRRPGPVRATPILVLPRGGLPLWLQLAPEPAAAQAGPVTEGELPELSSDAAAVYRRLVAGGASFFDELAAGARLLHTQLEAALAELVAAGLVTADSFTGLRALLVPAHKRPRVDRLPRATRAGGAGSLAAFGVQNAGRWSLLRPVAPAATSPAGAGAGSDPAAGSAFAVSGTPPAALEVAAWALLRRYGVVFRRLLERESLMPPWRDLLRVYRRLEARGEIRGGRFVDGFSGEQFALPEAVGRLRAVRREPRRGALVSVSAADPLNLVGIVTPGDRLPALAGNRVLFRDGEPIATWESRQARFLVELGVTERWQAQNALTRRPFQSAAPRLRAYLGRSA
ncbi:MAG TPA: DEAD/DEAH box helicase [Thermoanaerobaculia bacterium]